MKNVTRFNDTHQKKTRSLMTLNVDGTDIQAQEAFNVAGDFLIGYLPPDALITQAYVFTGVAGTGGVGGGVVTVGTSEGGTEIMSAGDIHAAGQSGTFTGRTQTGTGKPIYLNLVEPITDGAFVVFIEYSEYDLNTGELTPID